MALASELSVRATCTLTNPLDLQTAAAPIDYLARLRLVSGTGLGAADMLWSDQRTLAASATEDLDLAGSLTGLLGGTVTFARIKGLIVAASSANTNAVNVTRPASNGVPLFLAASDGIPVKPGGVFAWFDQSALGIAVTAATGDLITLTNGGSGTSVTYDIVIVGASA